MDRLTDVNWSEVVRGCLERYCSMRLDSDIEALAAKMKVQKEEAYSEGYKAALEWFKQEETSYEDVNAIFRELDDFVSAWDNKVEEEYGDWEKAHDEEPSIGERYEREKRTFFREKVAEIVKELPVSYDITDAFADGFKDALQKLVKVR